MPETYGETNQSKYINVFKEAMEGGNTIFVHRDAAYHDCAVWKGVPLVQTGEGHVPLSVDNWQSVDDKFAK